MYGNKVLILSRASRVEPDKAAKSVFPFKPLV